MRKSNLPDFEQRILLAIAFTVGFSKSGHYARGKIEQQYDKNLKKGLLSGNKVVVKRVNKAWKNLISKGYIVEHPTRNGITFQLSDIGFKEVMIIKETIKL